MSEYRRFISYMYAYDNGIKNKNVGFAKTECRGETVKLWINLKGAYSQEENYKVYFFVRRDGNIVGICMGDMVIKSGMGQFFAAEPLADIEIPFDDICGLYIGGKQGERMFASQWDDMPFDTKKVMGMAEYKAVLSAREAERAEKEHTLNEREAREQKVGEAAVKAVTGKQTGEDNAANVSVGKEPESRGVAATIEPPVWEKPIKMVYISDGERITRSENAPEMDSVMTNEETAGKETVKNEQEFMEIKELVHREHFNDCYGYMKYREEPLASMQFYVISEMNWSGNQEVAQWKYYSNGDFIDLDDTELRTKLLVAKNAENISWQL